MFGGKASFAMAGPDPAHNSSSSVSHPGLDDYARGTILSQAAGDSSLFASIQEAAA